MKKSILRTAIQISRDKLNKHPELCNFPHYSFIVQNNQIIEWATNANWSPPVHYGYGKPNEKGFVSKYHAEIYAWKRARDLLDGEFQIINVRLNKSGDLRLSKPCKSCYRLLTDLGCNSFYYSWDNGFMELK